MTVRQEVVRNALWMFAAEIVDKLFGPILIFLFARIFGSLVMGQYSFVLSFVAFAFMFSDMGTTVYAIKQCARNPKKLTHYLSYAAGMRIVLVGIAMAILLGSLFFIDKPSNVMIALIIYMLSTAVASIQNVFEITFYSKNDLKMIAIGRIIERIAITAVGVYAILVTKNFVAFVTAHLIAQLLHFSFIYFSSRKFAKPRLRFDWQIWKKFIIYGTPIALTSFLFFVYFRIDILMLSFLKGDQAVGWYSAAYRILDLVQFFPYILSYSVFPALLKLRKEDPRIADMLFNRAARMLLLLAVPLTYGIFYLAPLIIKLIYGADFIPSILALRVIILIVPLLFLDSLFRYVVYTINKEWHYLWILLALALFNVVTNFIFIPKYGFVAAAWTTLASEAIGFALLSHMILRGGFSLKLKKTIFSILRALFGSGIVYWVASTLWPYYVATVLSLITYAIVMLLIEFEEEDKELLKEAAGGIGKYAVHLYNLARSFVGI